MDLHRLRLGPLTLTEVSTLIAEHGWDGVLRELWDMAGDDLADRAFEAALLCLTHPDGQRGSVHEIARHAARIVVCSGSYNATNPRAQVFLATGSFVAPMTASKGASPVVMIATAPASDQPSAAPPDQPWVKCVLTGFHGEERTWCGREPLVTEWTFTDASHAALNGRAQGRLVACTRCAGAITQALAQGVEDGSSTEGNGS